MGRTISDPRKLIGGAGIVAGLVVYCAVAVWLATSVLPDHWAVALVFYPIAGLAWMYPAKKVIRWAQARDA